jgi:hypothetical protein
VFALVPPSLRSDDMPGRDEHKHVVVAYLPPIEGLVGCLRGVVETNFRLCIRLDRRTNPSMAILIERFPPLFKSIAASEVSRSSARWPPSLNGVSWTTSAVVVPAHERLIRRACARSLAAT